MTAIGTGCRIPEAALIPAAASPYKPAASTSTTPGRVVIGTPGAVVRGIDFRGCYLETKADNIVFEDCLLDLSVGANGIRQWIGAGMVVRFCTLRGRKTGGGPGVAVMAADAPATITDCLFEYLPADAAHMVAGVFERNLIRSIGWAAGAHADGLCIRRTLGPIRAACNLFDIRFDGQPAEANNAIRIIPEAGTIAHPIELVTNVTLGGAGYVYGIDARAAAVAVRGGITDRGKAGVLYPTRPANLVWEGVSEWGTGAPLNP